MNTLTIRDLRARLESLEKAAAPVARRIAKAGRKAARRSAPYARKALSSAQVTARRAQGPGPAIGAGIVAFADLRLGDAVGEVLDAHLAASPRFRGIRNGKPVNETQRYTDVWVRQDGRWQLAAEHTSLVP